MGVSVNSRINSRINSRTNSLPTLEHPHRTSTTNERTKKTRVSCDGCCGVTRRARLRREEARASRRGSELRQNGSGEPSPHFVRTRFDAACCSINEIERRLTDASDTTERAPPPIDRQPTRWLQPYGARDAASYMSAG